MSMFLRARQRAARNGIPFDLEATDVVIPKRCPVLGIRFGKHRDARPSLDRIVPSMGYTRGNIVVISMRANRLKSDATLGEMRKLAEFYNAVLQRGCVK